MSIMASSTLSSTVNKTLSLNVGCGSKPIPDTIGVDQILTPAVNVLASIEDSLPFGSQSFERIYAYQVLEHVTNLQGFMKEAHRLLCVGGRLIIEVPYFRSSWSHMDPTHVRHFTMLTFDYFVRGSYLGSEENAHATHHVAFSRIEKSLIIGPSPLGVKRAAGRLALRFPELFENSLLSSVFIFHGLHVELIK